MKNIDMIKNNPLLNEAYTYAVNTKNYELIDLMNLMEPDTLLKIERPLFFLDLVVDVKNFIEDFGLDFDGLSTPPIPDIDDEKYANDDDDCSLYIKDLYDYVIDMLLKIDERLMELKSYIKNNQFNFYNNLTENNYDTTDIFYFCQDSNLYARLEAHEAINIIKFNKAN